MIKAMWFRRYAEGEQAEEFNRVDAGIRHLLLMFGLSSWLTELAGIRLFHPPFQGDHPVSVTPHFSPSHAILSTTSLSIATAVVEIEASVFELAQKPQHCQKIGPPQ